MKKNLITIFITIMLLAGLVTTALAYVNSVDVVSGTFGSPTSLSSDPNVALGLVGVAPNQSFIQISDDSIIKFGLDSIIQVDGSVSSSDLVLDTYDLPFPAAAKIEVSSDGSIWVEVFGRALNDCDNTRTYVYDDVCPSGSSPSPDCKAYVDLTDTGLSQVAYVKLTDYPGSIDGETNYPQLGFDLDAIYEEHQAFQNCQPVDTIFVDIDIKPGSDPSCFNSNEHGVIPVAIFGSADFDVTQIDVTTVALNGAAVAVKGKADKALAAYEDVNSDEFMDLVVKIVDTGGYVPGDSSATLTGNLLPEFDGTPFEGTGDICITQ